MKSHLRPLTLASGLLLLLATAQAADQPVPAPPPAPQVSTIASEVARLSKAGVDAAVIRAYLENAGHSVPPGVNDLVYLREQGVSAELTTALIQRGTTVKKEAVKAAMDDNQIRAAQIAATAAAAVEHNQRLADAAAVAAQSVRPVITPPVYVRQPWPAPVAYGYATPYLGHHQLRLHYTSPACYPVPRSIVRGGYYARTLPPHHRYYYR